MCITLRQKEKHFLHYGRTLGLFVKRLLLLPTGEAKKEIQQVPELIADAVPYMRKVIKLS